MDIEIHRVFSSRLKNWLATWINVKIYRLRSLKKDQKFGGNAGLQHVSYVRWWVVGGVLFFVHTPVHCCPYTRATQGQASLHSKQTRGWGLFCQSKGFQSLTDWLTDRSRTSLLYQGKISSPRPRSGLSMVGKTMNYQTINPPKIQAFKKHESTPNHRIAVA